MNPKISIGLSLVLAIILLFNWVFLAHFSAALVFFLTILLIGNVVALLFPVKPETTR